ncbi:hypothetical protein F5Y06DRAFT_305309 [Hypoxylon sp. FL0890]|nr:hypothetical protein F5Y06DRAFT_305309 [Hypoxylon sp. FL0890]
MSHQLLILSPYRPQATTCGPPVPWQHPPPNALVLTPVSAPAPAPIPVPPPAPILAPILVPAPTFVPIATSLVWTLGPVSSYAASSVAPTEIRISINSHCPHHGNPGPTPGRTSRSEPRPNSPSRNTPSHVHQTEPQTGEDLLATQALRDLYRRNPTLHGKIWQVIATQLAKPGVLRARVIVDGLECPLLYTPAGEFGQEVARTLEPHIKEYVMIETGEAQYEEFRGAILDLACIAYRTVGVEAILRAQEVRRRQLEESMRRENNA